MTQRNEIQHRNLDFKVDINDFENLGFVNGGSYGSVYRVRDKKTGKVYAAKVLQHQRDENQYKIMMKREIETMMKYKHPTIINFIGYSMKDFNGKNNVTIFMDWAKNGSLESILKDSKLGRAPQEFDWTCRQNILIGIVKGMDFLHKHHIIHRDLKPGNILLDDQFRPLISDFGFAKKKENNSNTFNKSQNWGTLSYLPPEALYNNSNNEKTDVYSFGILMYQVVTNEDPYSFLTNNNLTDFKFSNLIIQKNVRPIFNKPIKKRIQRLIERCWSKDPKLRPTFDEIYQKLAYNNCDDIEDIYDDEEDKQDNKCDDDEYKYYLDGVNPELILSYVDELENSIKLNENKYTYTIEDTIRLIQNEIASQNAKNEENAKLISRFSVSHIQLINKVKNMQTQMTPFRNIQAEQKSMKKIIENLQSEINSLKNQINGSTTQKILMTNTYDEFQSILIKNEELITEIATMKNKFDDFQSELNSMKNKIDELTTENATLKSKINEYQSEENSMKNKINELQNQIIQIQSGKSSNIEKITECNEQIEYMKNKIDAVEIEKGSMNNQINELMSGYNKIQSEKSTFEDIINEFKATKINMSYIIDEIKKLQDEKDSIKDTLGELKGDTIQKNEAINLKTDSIIKHFKAENMNIKSYLKYIDKIFIEMTKNNPTLLERNENNNTLLPQQQQLKETIDPNIIVLNTNLISHQDPSFEIRYEKNKSKWKRNIQIFQNGALVYRCESTSSDKFGKIHLIYDNSNNNVGMIIHHKNEKCFTLYGNNSDLGETNPQLAGFAFYKVGGCDGILTFRVAIPDNSTVYTPVSKDEDLSKIALKNKKVDNVKIYTSLCPSMNRKNDLVLYLGDHKVQPSNKNCKIMDKQKNICIFNCYKSDKNTLTIDIKKPFTPLIGFLITVAITVS